MRRPACALMACAALSGCGGVLSPAGPVAADDRTILVTSLVIMLGIVVPTALATIAFAWWFRAGNARARRLPDWAYSGKIELVVWSVPLLVIMFLGGITYVGSHRLDPYRPLASDARPLEIEVVALDWKWLFIYPDRKVAALNELVVPAGVPLSFHITSATVMTAFFVPQLGSMIYAMNGMETRLHLQADAPGTFRGMASHYSGAGFADMDFAVKAVPQADFDAWVAQAAAGDRALGRGRLQGPAGGQHGRPAPRPSPGPRTTSSRASWPARRPTRPTASPATRAASPRRAGTEGRRGMFGRLTWNAIPFDEPIPMIASGIVVLVILGVSALVLVKGWLPYLWREWITSVDHKRIGVMYCLLAMVMLLRGFTDALMMRSQQALAYDAQGFLTPEHYDQILLRPRHHHDLLRGDGLHDRADELRPAAAARRARRGVPDLQLGRLLAHRVGGAPHQHQPRGGLVLAHGLAALPAAVGAEVLARRGRGLLSLGPADLGRGDADLGDQPAHHDPEDARAGDDLHADADVLLDVARLQPPHRRGLPDPDRDAGDADPRPLPRLPLLHQRRGGAT